MKKYISIFWLCAFFYNVSTQPINQNAHASNNFSSEEDEYDEVDETIPKTSFSCDGKVDGFYADIETDCRIYHYCQTFVFPDGDRDRTDFRYWCPPTTIFRQEYLTCASPHKSFNCSDSEQFYYVNEHKPSFPLTSTSSPLPSISTITASPPHSTSTSSTTPIPSQHTDVDSTTQAATTVPTRPPLAIDPFPIVSRIIQKNSPLPAFKPLWFTYQQNNIVKNKLPTSQKSNIPFKTETTSKNLFSRTVADIVAYNIKQLMTIFSDTKVSA